MVRFKTLQNATLIAIAAAFAVLLISTFQNSKSHDNSQSSPKDQGRDGNSSGEKPGTSTRGGGKREGTKADDLTALHWTAMSNGTPLPAGSAQGGYDSFPNRQLVLLYICRAELLGAVLPGKLFGGACYIGWDGREFPLNSYEILVGAGTQWGPPAPGFAGALVGGTGIHRENVYICRVEFQNYGLHVGYTVGDTCNIGWGGKEYAMPRPFEVLYPPGVTPPRAATDTTGAQNASPNPQEAQDASKSAAPESNTSPRPALKSARSLRAVYRVACGGQGAGQFSRDNYFAGGSVYRTSNRIATDAVPDPPPYQVYQSQRFGNFDYHFPGLTPRAPYEVRLHFAETWFNTGAVGSRVFNVFVNSREVLHHFDILAATGARDRAIVETFTANADDFGKLVIRFETVANNAMCSAIEVLDMAGAPASSTASNDSAVNPPPDRITPPYARTWKPRAATSTALVVQGNRGWTATGVFLNVGDNVKISASGSVSMGAGWPPMSPVGRPPDCFAANRVPRTGRLRSRYPADELPCWSLIGRIGDGGPIFYVGSIKALLAHASGQLWLGVNDDRLWDNTGAWGAVVTVQPGLEASRRAAVPR
jgi:hypothetical protein